jgi:hypothetical protein
MTAAKRDLTVQDVADVVALATESADPRQVYRAAERLAAETIGWRLFTILRYVEPAQPSSGSIQATGGLSVGGRKAIEQDRHPHGAMEHGEAFLAATKDEVRRAFFDHELIFSLSITAILNVPIRHAARRLGTINLCGAEGMYGPAEIVRARVLAGLLAPTLLMARD